MSSPFEKFDTKNSDRWEILVDIPKWERKRVLSWMHNILVEQVEDMFGATHNRFNVHIIRKIETRNRLIIKQDLSIESSNWTDLKNSLEQKLLSNPERFVLFLELVVKYLRDDTPSEFIKFYSQSMRPERALEILEEYLSNGSKWTVVESRNAKAGLVERVDSKLTDLAKSIDIDLLSEAWQESYGTKPNPERAIELAQSAVEEVASKRKLTTTTSSVYGNLLGDIKKNKSKKYISVAKEEFDLSTVLHGEKSSEIDVNDQYAEWFSTGLNLIQKTNPGRHKSNKTTNFKVSTDAARQAVLVATLICQLIDSGYISKTK